MLRIVKVSKKELLANVDMKMLRNVEVMIHPNI